MKRKHLLNYILCVMICISLLPAIPVKADTEERLWDNEFEGKGSDKITYRSYIEFEVYDDSTDEYLGTLKMDKKSGGNSIEGTYCIKYQGQDLITYRNDGNNCYIAKGKPTWYKDFWRFLYDNSNRNIRGHEKYRIEAHSVVKVYARGNLVGPYNGDGWKSLEECRAAEWTVDTSTKPGGKKNKTEYLSGTAKLNDAQQNNITRIFNEKFIYSFDPSGQDINITFDPNGGKFGDSSRQKKITTTAYEGVCISDIPTYGSYSFKGWSTTKYAAGKGPTDYYSLYHEGSGLSEIWQNTTLYAVWGPEESTIPAHTHTYVKKQMYSGSKCPICGEKLYFWAETCSTCRAYRQGEYLEHTCPECRVIYVSGECEVCAVSGSNEGSRTVTGNSQRILGIDDVGLKLQGHTFVGWNRSSDGTGTWYKKGDYYAGSNGQTVYMYAIWKPNNYTLHFDYKSEGLLNSERMIKGEASRVVSYDSIMSDLPDPYLTGFSFNGWYSAEKGVLVNEYMRYGIAGDSTFEADWGGSTIDVELDPAFPERANKQKVPAYFTLKDYVIELDYGTRYSSWIPLSLKPSCEGYTFLGWTYNGRLITENTICVCDESHTIKGSWAPKVITVTLDPALGAFRGKGEDEQISSEIQYRSVLSGANVLPSPKRDGYMFDGWYTERDGGGKKVESEGEFLLYENTTLYAKWIPMKYLAEFEYCTDWKYPATELSGTETENAFMTYNEIPSLPTPERYGYKFMGWSERYVYDAEHGAINGDIDNGFISSNVPWSITHNLKVYAVWKPLQVRVTYDYNYDYTEELPLP